MTLTDQQISKIVSASVLAFVAEAALSEFEADLLGSVAARFLDFGEFAFITGAEWAVIDAAIGAMSAAYRPSHTIFVELSPQSGIARCRAAPGVST